MARRNEMEDGAGRDEAPPRPRPPRQLRKKKARAPRVRLTHLEIRRGDVLRLRIAVADDALAEIGEELGALIKKIAPSTQTTVVTTPMANIIIEQQHTEDDATYHTDLRGQLAGLFSSLCDTSLADALEIVREERNRRAEGGN